MTVSGRYNRGRDRFPPEQSWAALYLALDAETCLAELMRHITPVLLPTLNDYRLSQIDVALSAVADIQRPSECGIDVARLVDDWDYALPQALAREAFAQGCEAMLVPSATLLGNNIVVFPQNLHDDSGLMMNSSRDPRLFVSRDSSP